MGFAGPPVSFSMHAYINILIKKQHLSSGFHLTSLSPSVPFSALVPGKVTNLSFLGDSPYCGFLQLWTLHIMLLGPKLGN